MTASFITFRHVLAGITLSVVASSGLLVACASEPPAQIGEVQEALVPTDPVSKAVSDSCTTSSVKGLSVQLIAEIQCLQPGSFTELQIANTDMAPAVFPYLQTPAAAALAKVAAARNVKLSINSATRALPQQFLLYRWYKQGRCGIGLAAKPGNSNHESGIAVDVDDNAAWRTAFEANGFKWLGASDPVHFDYKGPGVIDMDGLSVYAFQRLWNRNHPEDLIAEDKDFGDETESRLAKAPVGGFPVGANCGSSPVDAGSDAPVIAIIDAGRAPVKNDASTASAPAVPPEETGCSMHSSGANAARMPNGGSFSVAGIMVAIVIVFRRRARRVA